MIARNMFVAASFIIAAVVTGLAQQRTVSKAGDTVKATATIVRIDSTSRLITFKDEKGAENTVVAGPEVARFNELKVGDKVNLTYYESKVFKIRKPGEPALTGTSGSAVTPSSGPLPGGTIATQTAQSVTVKSVDAQAGTITVVTPDGHTVSRKVDDKANLTGVKPGDRIDIVYTEAVVASIERGK
jgi:Cu/Ag efflux protein CusF